MVKRKPIILANHRTKKRNEPIRIRSNNMQSAPSAGNVSRDWIWFSLVEKSGRQFSQSMAEQSKAKPKQTRITFDTQLNTALIQLFNSLYKNIIAPPFLLCYVTLRYVTLYHVMFIITINITITIISTVVSLSSPSAPIPAASALAPSVKILSPYNYSSSKLLTFRTSS